MEFRERVLKGVVWAAVERWGSQIVGLVILLLLARRLEPSAFGMIAMAAVFIALIEAVVDHGLAEALIQRKDLEPEHLDSAFWVNVGTGVAMCIVCVTLAGPISHVMKQPALKPVLQWLSISFVFGGLRAVQEALLRRSLKFRTLALRTLVGHIAGGVVAVTMASRGYGVWSLVALELTRRSTATAVLWMATWWRPGLRFSAAHVRDLIPFSLYVVGIRLLNFLNTRSDDLLIGAVLGPVALGYYTVAYQLIRQIERFITGVTSQVAFPAFARLQHDPEQLRQAFYTATRYTSFIALPVFLGFAVLAPEVVGVVFGPKWSRSIPVMQILAFIGLLQVMYYFNGNVLMAMGKPSWRFQLNMLNAVTNVIAFAIAVRWGIVAVAIAFTVRGYLFSPLSIICVHKLLHLDFRRYVAGVAPACKAAAAMIMVVLGMKHFGTPFTTNAHIVLFFLCMGGAGTYLLGMRLAAPGALTSIRRAVGEMVR
jgi:O-antigen/teichoic acid export membrane protein